MGFHWSEVQREWGTHTTFRKVLAAQILEEKRLGGHMADNTRDFWAWRK